MHKTIAFSELPEKELFPGIRARISHSDKATLTRVTLDEGSLLPEHHHVHEQWTTVLEGELEMELEGERTVLKPGMSIQIPSNVPHAAIARTHCVVLDMFIPKRDDL